jgi:tellurite resistance protein
VSVREQTVFGDRRKALEEEFFRKQDAKLVEALRVAQEKKALRDVLAQTGSKISDSVIDTLFEHGVTPRALAALALIPLVIVAWADGSIEPKEKSAVLQAATSMGVATDGPGYALLQSWLDHKPPAKLLEAWETYAVTLARTLSPADRDNMKADVIGRARDIAKAAGGFLGIAKISAAEEQALQRLAQAFDGSAPA